MDAGLPSFPLLYDLQVIPHICASNLLSSGELDFYYFLWAFKTSYYGITEVMYITM